MAEIPKKITRSAILVSRVYVSDFQKEGSETAELKQTVKTVTSYPSKTVDSNLSDNVFKAEEFGYETQDFASERTNVAWINVPVGTTPEQVLARLKTKVKAVLYRIISSKPVLSDNQKYAINAEIATMDQFADKQVVRHGSDDEDGKWAKGDLVLDKLGRPIYKAVFLSLDGKEDVDLTTDNAFDFYASDAIKAEMSGVLASVEQAI